MANYNNGEQAEEDKRTCPNCLSNDNWEDEKENLHCENCLYVEEDDN
jgi:hypothetical protein